MNLTELSSFVCEQCGMTADEDLWAAKLFIQRRLQMIWNSQLWRAALVEASLTVSPDGTSTLADSVWIPSRGTLLLPSDIQTVLGVRTSGHALNVASLESYFRTDADLLAMQGDPAEFQVLRPAVWEFDAATDIAVLSDSGEESTGYGIDTSADGVKITATQGLFNSTTLSGVLAVTKINGPASKGTISLAATRVVSGIAGNFTTTLTPDGYGGPYVLPNFTWTWLYGAPTSYLIECGSVSGTATFTDTVINGVSTAWEASGYAGAFPVATFSATQYMAVQPYWLGATWIRMAPCNASGTRTGDWSDWQDFTANISTDNISASP